MEQRTAQRRLVKSPPELWAEVSSEQALGRRLAEFGEIRITRLEPETTVAWEGERASGTVELAPAGWGTKVILTATVTEPQAAMAEAPAGREPDAPAGREPATSAEKPEYVVITAEPERATRPAAPETTSTARTEPAAVAARPARSQPSSVAATPARPA
ncbi:MAG: hypothetical protein ACRDLN_12615, partial [Solirubrobacteraceae bacterium]